MKTDANDIKGVLVWSEHDYELSTSTIRYQDYRLAKEITIAQFYYFIREMWGMHRYQFSGGGSGCHFWV